MEDLVARVIAFVRVLDFDDIRAQVGEQLARPWADEHAREIENLESGQRWRTRLVHRSVRERGKAGDRASGDVVILEANAGNLALQRFARWLREEVGRAVDRA